MIVIADLSSLLFTPVGLLLVCALETLSGDSVTWAGLPAAGIGCMKEHVILKGVGICVWTLCL